MGADRKDTPKSMKHSAADQGQRLNQNYPIHNDIPMTPSPKPTHNPPTLTTTTTPPTKFSIPGPTAISSVRSSLSENPEDMNDINADDKTDRHVRLNFEIRS